MRVGPSRLISTALSRGESNDDGGRGVDDDVAGGERGAVGVVEPEPVGADVAGDRWRRAGRPSPRTARSLAELGAEAVEGVVLEDLPLDPLRRPSCACPARTSSTSSQSGHAAQQPLDQRGADEAGAAGDGDALASERFGDAQCCPLPAVGRSADLPFLRRSGGSLRSLPSAPRWGGSLRSLPSAPRRSGGSLRSLPSAPRRSGGSLRSLPSAPRRSGGSLRSLPSPPLGRLASLATPLPAARAARFARYLPLPAARAARYLSAPRRSGGSLRSLPSAPRRSGGSLRSRSRTLSTIW